MEFVDGRRVHPVAALFPMMSEAEIRELADDIERNGLQNPVVVAYADESCTETVLIDGRNRSAACALLGEEPVTELWDSRFWPLEDFNERIISWNLQRRHLTASQRAAVAVEYERVFAVEAKKRQVAELAQNRDDTVEPNPAQRANPEDGRAAKQAADLFNVGKSSVKDAKYVAENAPDTFEKVKSGDVAVSTAAKSLRAQNDPKPEPSDEERARKDAQRIARKGNTYLKALITELLKVLEDD